MKIKTRDQCWGIIVDTLNELLEELDLEPEEIEADTMLNQDLGLSSVDGIHLMIMLEDQVSKPLNFQELAVVDGEYVDDLSAGQLLEYVAKGLKLPMAAA